MTRCPWLPLQHPLYVEYHDAEWGVPSRDPRYLFECICLEGAQCGLSWWTVLQKRERYRQVFHNFEPEKVAEMTDAQLEKLLLDPGIIRHRGKIQSVRQNARAWLALENPVEWLWSFVGGELVVHPVQDHRRLPNPFSGIRLAFQGPEKGGFQLRRHHHHVCLHAGRRHDERPHHRLLPEKKRQFRRITRSRSILMAGIGISLFLSPRATLPPEERTATKEKLPPSKIAPRFKKRRKSSSPHFGFRQRFFARDRGFGNVTRRSFRNCRSRGVIFK